MNYIVSVLLFDFHPNDTRFIKQIHLKQKRKKISVRHHNHNATAI